MRAAPINAMIVPIRIDQPIWTSCGGVIEAPAPIGVVAAMAMRPPPKSSRVPIVSIASRMDPHSRDGLCATELRFAL